MVEHDFWDTYIGKCVELLINDVPYPRKREGIFIGLDSTHVWLQTTIQDEPIPFLRTSIKRIDIHKEHKENDKTKRRDY